MNASRSLTLFLALALAGFVLLAFSTPTARAADPVVVRVTVNGATSGACGDTWATACGLQYALTTVALPGTETELWVAAGTYTATTGTDRTATFQLRDNIALYGGFAMTETLRSQRNVTANAAVLSGDIGTPGDSSDNAYHVVTASGVTNTAVLDGFFVTGGNANATGGAVPNWRGGGMYNEGGSPTVANVTFSENFALDGGGVYNEGGSPTFTNVTFSRNSADGAGGLENWKSNPTLTNVTFSNNSATMAGGMQTSNGSPTLTNVTFYSNSASLGAGIYIYSGTPTIRNAIFWDATWGGEEFFNSLSTPNISDSVVQGGCPSGSTCTHLVTADPHLGALSDYGGSTETVPLLPGSSAINAGNNPTCAPSDQRGKPRVGACDIGAFESQGFILTKTSGDNQSTPVNTAFATPLRVTVSSASGEPVNGGSVSFTAPSSGASTIPMTSTVVIASDAVTQAFSANGIAGSYAVTANTAGAATPATFSLTNLLHELNLPLIGR